MQSTATAVWTGGLKDGKGSLAAGNGSFSNVPYDFGKRFEGTAGPGTTPEELIAAAHAGCYAMALSGTLGGAGFPPEKISVKAVVTLDRVDGKATVTKSALTVAAKVPGIDAAKFAALAEETKLGCPISRLLKAELSLEAKLES
jgi:osmotically inducible protein OsmC